MTRPSSFRLRPTAEPRFYTATRFALELPEPSNPVDVRVLNTAYEKLGNEAAHLTLGNQFLGEQFLLDGALMSNQIATPAAWPPIGAMKLYPKGDGEYYMLDAAGIETPLRSAGGCIHEEFLPAAGATSVTLSKAPQQITMVARDGVVQSESAGHYAMAAMGVDFVDPFTGLEQVIVEYALDVLTGAGIIDGGRLQPGTVGPEAIEDPYTQPMIPTPTTFPPVGSMRIYPKADGEYYKITELGVETPLAIGGGGTVPDPLTVGTLIVTLAATLPVTVTVSGAFEMTQIVTPIPPAAGAMKLYPKADGLFYKQDAAGVETPLVGSPGWTPPLTPVTVGGSRHDVGSRVLDDLLTALASLGLINDVTTA